MSKKRQFTIQIRETVVVSKTIEAESFKEACAVAEKIVDAGTKLFRPARPWGEEWRESREVVGVFS